MQRPIAVEGALAGLIHQFSDRYAFLRELVQNAIDAGTQEISVTCEFEAGRDGGDAGVATIGVADWGCGMTREIVEQKLIRLFASSKDGDRTKIGKFGIGFVSVFALDPDAVCVDTAREGERWRLLFGRDHTCDLRRLDAALEGTRVRVIKAMTRAEFDDLRIRVRAVVRHWCRHVGVELRVDGERINAPFEIEDAPCQVAVAAADLEIAVGHPQDGVARFGYYNAGLTLHEGTGGQLEGFAFKVKSPGLEHTLTRDRVIENTGWRRAIDAVRRAVAEQLAARAVTMLADELARGEPTASLDYLAGAVLCHVRHGLRSSVRRVPLFLAPSGRRLSMRAIGRRHRSSELLVVEERSALSDALEAQGRTVVLVHGAGVLALLSALVRAQVEIDHAERRWCLAVPDDGPSDPAATSALLDGVARLLAGLGGRLHGVVLGRMHGDDADTAVAITQLGQGTPTPRPGAAVVGTSWLGRRRWLVINGAHRLVPGLVALSQREPELAAYLLVKAFWLGASLDPAQDGRLSAVAWELALARRGVSDG